MGVNDEENQSKPDHGCDMDLCRLPVFCYEQNIGGIYVAGGRRGKSDFCAMYHAAQ